MGSEPKGKIVVLGWQDGTADELKALVNDDGRIPISVDGQLNYIGVQTYCYDGVMWMKMPVTWGYTDVYSENNNWTSDGTSPYNISFDTVPSNQVWWINAFCCRHNDVNPIIMGLRANIDGVNQWINQDRALTQWTFLYNIQPIVLKAGDNLYIEVRNLPAASIAYGFATGYIMKLRM